MDRYEAWAKLERTLKMTVTYVRKSEVHLDSMESHYASYWTLADELIYAVNEIAERLPEEHFVTERAESVLPEINAEPFDYNASDVLLEGAEKLLATIQRRRKDIGRLARIRKLEAVEGRTPEEAAAFRRKAAELRGRASG